MLHRMEWTSTLFLLLFTCTLLACGRSAAEPALAAAPALAVDPQAPLVVVELFTSQGCSSCPAADRLLSSLGPAEGLLTLAYHVDYWNYLGWQDPFSKAQWSARQEAYSRTLPAGRVYTPQAVIQGRQHCVGSRRDCIDQAVAAVRALAQDQAQNSTLQGSARRQGNTLEIRLEASSSSSQPLEALAVVFENHLETPVGSGENARRTLRNDRVVRVLQPVFRLNEGVGSGTARIELEEDWNLDHLGVAALLQDPQNLTLHGAWSADFPHSEAPAP